MKAFMDRAQDSENLPEAKRPSFKTMVLLAVVVALFLAYCFYFYQNAPNGQANLSWNANPEEDLAGYRIYYGQSPRTSDCPAGGYAEKLDAGKTTTPEKPSYKFEKLESGKTYYFSVTSYDSSGNESCFSAEMSKAISSSR